MSCLSQHQLQLLACDFFTVETLRLQTLSVLCFLEIGIRCIHLAGCTVKPTVAWVAQQARQLVWKLQEEGQRTRFLLHNRDATFPTNFGTVVASERIDVILTPTERQRLCRALCACDLPWKEASQVPTAKYRRIYCD